MPRKSSVVLEDLIGSLEYLIDTLDDEWMANNEGRWRQADNLRSRTIPEAKEKFKMYLDEYIDRRIQTYIDRTGGGQ